MRDVEKPANIHESWRYLPLTADRTPLKNYRRDSHPEYWAGISGTWDDLVEWTTDGKAMGLLTHESNLVVIDCDQKTTFDVSGNSARPVQHHGIDDLKRVAAELGETITPTFTVHSKSGGYHLYYRANDDWPVRSRGHRDGWIIDVKASPRTFVVTVPTAGYTVVRDLPVATIPEWLARFTFQLKARTEPLGGRVVREKMMEIREIRDNPNGTMTSGGELYERWKTLTLELVTESSDHGGWNDRIYVTARQFFDVGIDADEAAELIAEAAKPWNQRELHNVQRTVASAWDGHVRDSGGAAYWAYGREI